ncbi:hypothetical protein M8C21_005971 [Ambrosia artemisiifolia]|uniref:Uncharacterized protein n=1 Tax=Ambrosia artemisiifolia TaxID=4212 RepID=A0AAD5CCA2_AMBAR|nr:hypothetical protein M8C21_005971 [Ambrosia artemisiifolia]
MNMCVGVVAGGPLLVAAAAAKKEEEGHGHGRRRALKMVDRELSNANFKSALSLLKQLQRHPPPAGLSGFAAATQVPRRVSSVELLHLSVTQTSTLHSLFDAILYSINTSLQSSSSPLHEQQQETCVTGDEHNDLYLQDDVIQHKQVAHHEAGHFLVGYLLGVLPKHYKFSCMEDKIADANVKFLGFEFLTELDDVVLSNKHLHEVKRGNRAKKRKLSNTVVSKFACVIVGGLVAEHLAFGYSKGHHGDVEKLDRVLKWLQFTEGEANNLTRWAVLNTLTILHRHTKARSTLAEAMLDGRSIGYCIDVIETNLNHQNI